MIHITSLMVLLYIWLRASKHRRLQMLGQELLQLVLLREELPLQLAELV